MVKELKHYIDKIQEKFPYLSKSEITQILIFGLRRYGWVNRMHCDVLICNRLEQPMNAFCGRLGYDTFKHYLNWVTKSRMKERVMWRLKHKVWDGYYYIGVDQNQHDELMNQHGKFKTFNGAYLTKIKQELYHNKIVKHIWRVPWSADCGWKFYIDKLRTKDAEYIGPNQYEKYHNCFLGKYN